MRRSLLLAILGSTVAVEVGAQNPRLVPLATFGCEECTDARLLTGVEAIAVSADGRVVLVDGTAPLVRIFEPDGRVVAAFGRRGDGPAELRLATAVAQGKNGVVEVVDMMRQRVVRFGPGGDDSGNVTLGGLATAASFAPAGGHVLAALTTPRARDLRIVRVRPNGRAVELPAISASAFPQRRPGNPEALSLAVAPDGSFAVGDGTGSYLIRRYAADGKPIAEITRAIARERLTPAERRAEAERRDDRMARMRAMVGGGANRPASPASTDAPAERDFFGANALRFDESGRLWVRVDRGPRESTRFDIFDARGGYLGEASVPVEIKDFALGAGLLVAIVPNDLGVEQVRSWRVR